MKPKKVKPVEESYRITLRGLIGDEVTDAIELYMYKFGYNGIVFDEDKILSFEKVEYRKVKP